MFTDIRNEVRSTVEGGEKYSVIAKQSGISPTTLSQFINGSYAGDNQRVADKLAVWLADRRTAGSLRAAPSFVKTPTSKKIFSALDYAKISGVFVVIYGNSGVGKTNAITEYAKKPNTWLITARPSSSRLLECLSDIAYALELDYAPKRIGALSSHICRKLRGTQGLLIVDEADHLPYDVLEEIRLIQEMTGVGVVLCGNHQIYSKLSGGGTRKTDFARLFSRIAKKLAILNVTAGDIDAIADAWGIDGERERKLVHELGRRAGALRIIKTTLSLAAILANSSNSAINEAHISAAIRDLEGV